MPDELPPQIGRCPNILLSIKPEHAEAILSGEKQYEYRKVAPARGPPMRLVLYASAPVQKAIGVAWSYKVLQKPVPELIEKTINFTPHDRDDVLDYFGDAESGYAIHIASYRRFDNEVARENLDAFDLSPSQNFRYIEDVPGHERIVEPETVVVNV
jgi:predicted transcriptional regulator